MILLQNSKSADIIQPCFLFLVLCSFYVNGYDEYEDAEYNFPIFYTLKQVFDVINEQAQYYPEEVKELYDAYHEKCNVTNESPLQPGARKKPFIVIEGNFRSNREAIGKHIARRLEGKMLLTPPSCLANLTNIFPRGSRLRTAFFGLSNYVAAAQVRQLLAQNTPAVMNGYWTDQSSFIIGRRYVKSADLPPRGDAIYNFPSDLTPPDLMFYVNYPFDRHNQPFTTPFPYFKPKKLLIYQRFRYPKMIEVSTTAGFHHAVNLIYDNIYNLLGRKYDLSFRERRP